MTTLRTNIVVALTLLAAATCLRAADDKEAIQTRLDEFAAAWNQHNPEQMAAIWADDGDLINPSGRKAQGRDQVRQLFADEHNGVMKQSHNDMKVDSVRKVGDVALVDADTEITGMRSQDGSELPAHKFHIFLVMTNQDEKWMVQAARAYLFSPPPGAQPQGAEKPAGEN